MIPLIQIADRICTKKEPLDVSYLRNQLSDSICLLGHGILGLSHRRRSALRPYFTEKFKPICSSDVPVDNFLFSKDALKLLKEMGDFTKIPLCVKSYNNISNLNRGLGQRYGYGNQNQNLNYRGPVYMQGNYQGRRNPPPYMRG